MKKAAWGILGLLILGSAVSLHAEPYFAAMKGVNCNACHVNQTGGWARNDFGKTFGNSLETFDWKGIAETAQVIKHNTPSWISVGLDLEEGYRATFNQNSAFNQNQFAGDLFHREAFEVWVKANEAVSGVFTYRLDETGSIATKEAYAMVSGLPSGAYLKLGKFTTPYGLELSDDRSLVRGFLDTLAGKFSFDNLPSDGLEAGIYPDVFFVNTALTNGDTVNNEKILSGKAGFTLPELTLGGSFYGENMDLATKRMRYGAFGWGHAGPLVFLGEMDMGTDGTGLTEVDLRAAHASMEADLGSSVYGRLTTEWAAVSSDNYANNFRFVATLKCYPVRNLKAQLDLERMALSSGVVNDSALLDAYLFY